MLFRGSILYGRKKGVDRGIAIMAGSNRAHQESEDPFFAAYVLSAAASTPSSATALVLPAFFPRRCQLIDLRQILIRDLRFVVDRSMNAHFPDGIRERLIVRKDIADRTHHVRVPASRENHPHGFLPALKTYTLTPDTK